MRSLPPPGRSRLCTRMPVISGDAPGSALSCMPLQLHEVPVSVRCGTLSRRERVWYWSWRRHVWCRRRRGEDPERYELRCEEGRRRCAVGGASAQSCACRSRWRARRWWVRRIARRCQQRSWHQPGVRRPKPPPCHAAAAAAPCPAAPPPCARSRRAGRIWPACLAALPLLE